ncbi:hypothetical protein AAVH_42340, partial [Aphelenchoides avenae]
FVTLNICYAMQLGTFRYGVLLTMMISVRHRVASESFSCCTVSVDHVLLRPLVYVLHRAAEVCEVRRHRSANGRHRRARCHRSIRPGFLGPK